MSRKEENPVLLGSRQDQIPAKEAFEHGPRIPPVSAPARWILEGNVIEATFAHRPSLRASSGINAITNNNTVHPSTADLVHGLRARPYIVYVCFRWFLRRCPEASLCRDATEKFDRRVTLWRTTDTPWAWIIPSRVGTEGYFTSGQPGRPPSTNPRAQTFFLALGQIHDALTRDFAVLVILIDATGVPRTVREVIGLSGDLGLTTDGYGGCFRTL